MSFEPSLDRHLAEALGDFSPLIAELRATFLASATAHVAALSLATDTATWRSEAARLQGLAASFGMTELLQAAGDARGPRSRIARSDRDGARRLPMKARA